MTKNLIFQDFQGPGKHTDQFPKLSKTCTKYTVLSMKMASDTDMTQDAIC